MAGALKIFAYKRSAFVFNSPVFSAHHRVRRDPANGQRVPSRVPGGADAARGAVCRGSKSEIALRYSTLIALVCGSKRKEKNFSEKLAAAGGAQQTASEGALVDA